jgi:hypothetical protein
MSGRLSRGFNGVAAFLSLLPTVCDAHSFGTPYVLPLPLWMYVYGCAATLILTFAALGFLAGAQETPGSAFNRAANARAITFPMGRLGLWVFRAGAAACLLLTVLAGFIGSADAGQNIGMCLFWVLFLQGFAYLTCFIGDLYALINPWRWAVAALERMGLDLSTRRVRYSPQWSYWPAFFSYLALIWIELFIGPKPCALAIALLLYGAITFVGVTLVGKAVWFEHADVFSVLFRLVGRMAPVEYVRGRDDTSWRVRLRLPFTGTLSDRPHHWSLVLFVLLMLSSTTYDAIHDTALWIGLYWRQGLWFLQPLWGDDLGKAQQMLMGGYLIYRQVGLLLFPFLYFLLYLFALWAAKALTRTPLPVRTLALGFCYSLIPIAIAYHFTHYCAFLLTQIRQLPQFMSDPFGFGWNLLRIGRNSAQPVLQMGMIWHTQVGLLLAGHVVSVVLAHRIAKVTFSTRRQVIISQVPLLGLMVAYTVLGLWILSLPLGSRE